MKRKMKFSTKQKSLFEEDDSGKLIENSFIKEENG